MLGVDSTCAFDLGQILPHSLWLSCQHPPHPPPQLLVLTDWAGRALTPAPSQAGLPSAPSPNVLDSQAHVPNMRMQTASLLCQKPVVTLFSFLFCVHEFV